jgi:hypothetical protein
LRICCGWGSNGKRSRQEEERCEDGEAHVGGLACLRSCSAIE